MGETYRPNQGSETARNDPISSRIDALDTRSAHGLDKRKTVTYTFEGTGEESFLHELGKIPKGAIPVSVDQHATFTINQEKTTAQRIYMRSSVAGTRVTFLLF